MKATDDRVDRLLAQAIHHASEAFSVLVEMTRRPPTVPTARLATVHLTKAVAASQHLLARLIDLQEQTP